MKTEYKVATIKMQSYRGLANKLRVCPSSSLQFIIIQVSRCARINYYITRYVTIFLKLLLQYKMLVYIFFHSGFVEVIKRFWVIIFASLLIVFLLDIQAR